MLERLIAQIYKAVAQGDRAATLILISRLADLVDLPPWMIVRLTGIEI